MTDQRNICYCGEYGGGVHTRSARCPGGELRTLEGEPALTQSSGLPGTREPVVIAPQGNAGESPPRLLSSKKDTTMYLGMDREELREIIGERETELERLRAEAEVADEQLAQLRGFAEAHRSCKGADETQSASALPNIEYKGTDETRVSRTNDEAILRGLLAAAYSGGNLYCDDGELQDGAELPVIDYLRDGVLEIERKIRERGMRKLAAARSAEETSAELWKRQADFASEREMTALRQLARTAGLLLEALEALAVNPAQRDERKHGMSWIELASRNAKIARDALDAYQVAGGPPEETSEYALRVQAPPGMKAIHMPYLQPDGTSEWQKRHVNGSTNGGNK